MRDTSIVIPCYNARRYLSQCLESIAALGDPYPEVVVVDDGSVDDVTDIVGRFAPWARYLRQANQGPGAARNAGIALTSRPYVRFLDADDWLLAGTELSAQTALLDADPEVALVYGGALVVSEDGQPVGLRRVPLSRAIGVQAGDDAVRCLLLGNHITTSTVIARRRALEAVDPMRTDIRGAEDWDYWLRIAAQGSLGYVSAPVAAYRLHPQSLTAGYTTLSRHELHLDILRRFLADDDRGRFADMRMRAVAALDVAAARNAYRNEHMELCRSYARTGLFHTLSQRQWSHAARAATLICRSMIPVGVRRSLRTWNRRRHIKAFQSHDAVKRATPGASLRAL